MSNELAAQFDEHMSHLACEPWPGRLDADEERIRKFEEHIGADLPEDYRVFLGKYAGSYVSATCELLEPSPCGQTVVIEKIYGFLPEDDYGSLEEVSDDADGAPVVIPIAEGGFGSQYFLILGGELKNSIFFFDSQQRWFWPDEKFREMYDDLHPDIEEFLRKRAANELTEKPDGMENFYLVAESFKGFVESMDFWDLELDD